MAWVAVDKAGREWIFAYKPYRESGNHRLLGLHESEFWSDAYGN